MEEETPRVLKNADRSCTTPSVVAFTVEGERIVGADAKKQALSNFTNTVQNIKNIIGRKFNEPEVQKYQHTSGIKIVKASNGDAWVEVDRDIFSPSQITSFVLGKMKEIAEHHLGHTVKSCVLSIPQNFNESQRKATVDAAHITGLKDVTVLTEGHAAVLAYGMEKSESKIIAVYKFGGQNFSISVIEVDQGVVKVRSTISNALIGGDVFDDLIADEVATRFQLEQGIDIKCDFFAMQFVKEAAEKAKIDLSTLLETDIQVPFVTADASGPKDINCKLTREELEAIVGDAINRTTESCRKCMTDAGIRESDVTEVILIGGMTYMPKVRQEVEQIFSQSPITSLNPDEAVAVGAAIQGTLGNKPGKEILHVTTPLALGVRTVGGVFTAVIERNTELPTKKSQIFSTASDKQIQVKIEVLQGEKKMAVDNHLLGEFTLVGISPAPCGEPQIEIEFDIDVSGIAHVSAKDIETGLKQQIILQACSGLHDEEIKQIIANAENLADEGKEKKESHDSSSSVPYLLEAGEFTSDRPYALQLSDDNSSQVIDEAEAKLTAQEIRRHRSSVAALPYVYQYCRLCQRIVTEGKNQTVHRIEWSNHIKGKPHSNAVDVSEQVSDQIEPMFVTDPNNPYGTIIDLNTFDKTSDTSAEIEQVIDTENVDQ